MKNFVFCFGVGNLGIKIFRKKKIIYVSRNKFDPTLFRIN